MTRPTSHNPKKRRMRSRLRERLDDLLAQTPLPVRQERLAAPQVRLLESRFVLDASAALVGLDALSSGWEAQSAEVQSDASHGAAVASQEHMFESVEVSSTVPGHSFSEARQFASTGASNDALGLDLDLGFGSDLTSELNMSLAIADPQADSMAGDSNSVEFEFGEVERSPGARFAADERATHVIEARDSEGLPLSLDDSEGESGFVVSLDFPQVAQGNDADVPGSGSDLMMAGPGQSNPDANEIVFIDAGVQDHETLEAGFREGVEVLILEGTQDGVTQISQALQGRADLDAIHLISHGSAGSLRLGSAELSSESMAQYADALSQIGSSLTQSGDLMLYGCDVAQGEIGQAFISALATASDADVAASNDRTGDAGLGGDWVLESKSGEVGTAVLIDDTVMTGYAHVLAPPSVLGVEVSDTTITDSDDGSAFTVTVTFDQVMNPGGAVQPTLTFNPDVLLAGTLTNPSAGSWSAGDTVFTKTFDVVDVGVEVTDVEIDVTGAENASGEAQTNYAAEAEFSIDTLNPTVVVNIVESQLSDGTPSSLVTFEFSEDVTGFDVSDLSVIGGLISGFTSVDANSFQATFTANDGVDALGEVSVAVTYTDLVGNAGTTGLDTVAIDRLNPTVVVNVIESQLTDGNVSSLVTFEFDEDVTGFDVGDLTATGGSITGFTSVNESSYEATFTAADGVDTLGEVSVAATYTDLLGNAGTTGLDTVAIDRLNPTVVVDVIESQLTDGNTSSLVTFEFSEDVAGFDVTDLSSVGGSISDFTMVDANSYTALFTASDGVAMMGSVTANSTYEDLNGNAGVAGFDTVLIDRVNPTVTSVVRADGNYTNAGTVDFTVTFSEDVTGVDADGSDFSLVTSVVGASIDTVTGSNSVYTVTVNTGTTSGSIGLILAATPTIQDVAGNDLIDSVISGTNESYAVASTEVLLVGGNVSVTDIREATADDLTLSVVAGDLVISSSSGVIAAGAGVTRINGSSVSVALLDITGSDGIAVVAAGLDDTVTIEGIERRLEVDGGGGADTVHFQTSTISTNGGDLLVDAEFITQDASASIAADNISLNAVSGDLELNAALTATGDLIIDASGEVSQRLPGIVLVAGDTTVSANQITLDNASNDFQGIVNASGTELSFADSNGISLGDIDAAGAFSVTALGGAIDDGTADANGADVNVAGVATLTASGMITLDDQWNDFGDQINVDAQDVVLAAQSDVLLLAVDVDQLEITAAGNVSDGEAGSVLVAGNASFTASEVTLGDNAGNIARFGNLTFNASGVVDVSEDGRMDVAGVSTAGAGLNLLSTDDITLDGSVTVVGDTSIVAGTTSGGIAVNAKLNGSGTILLDAADEITIDASIDPTTVTLNADDDITVNAAVVASELIAVSAGEDGSGSFILGAAGSLETTDSGSDITVTTGASTGDITLTGTTTALDQVTMTSASGSINGSGLVTSDTVDLNASSGIGNTTGVALSSSNITADTTTGDVEIANNLGTAVSVSSLSTGTGSVSFDQSGGGDLSTSTVSASGAVTLANAAGSLSLAGAVTGDSLDASASGAITDDSDGDLAIAGLAEFTAGSLELGNDAGNATNFGTLTFNSAGSVTISEDSSVDLVGINTAGSADLDSVAGVSDAGATSLNVTGLLDVSGTSVVLGSGTFNASTLTFSSAGSVTISEDSSLDLVGINTADSANLASTAGVSDAGADSVNVTGLLDVSGTSVALGSGASVFNTGTLTFSSAGSVTISETSSLDLVGINTASSADLDSTAGVSDAGAASLDVIGLLDVSGTSVVLGSGTFNAGTLTFSSAGSVTISEDSSLDLVGDNTAGSADLNSTAGVSDAGATGLNVTGLLDVSGTSIALGSGTSVFNTGALTFSSAGSVTISEDSSLDLVGTNAADSVDLDSTAGVSDVGAASVDVTGLLDVSGTSIALGSGTSVFNAGTLTFSSAGSVTISEASSLDLVGINTANSADLDSTAGVSDAGAASVNVIGLLDVSGTSTALGSGASVFNTGTLTFSSAGSVTVSEASSLDLVGTNAAGSADLDSTAGVSDAGAVSVNVTGLLDVSGTSIALGSGASVFNAGTLTFNSAGSVTISETSSLDLVAINTANSADLDSTAGVSDATAVSVEVTGLLGVSGTSIALGSGASVFNTGTLTFSSSGSVTISEASSLDLVGINTASSADVDSTAGVSDAGAVSVDVTGLLDVSGASIALGSGTSVFNAGTLTFNSTGSVTVSEDSSLDLVGTNTAGSASLVSVAGVSDAGAVSVNVTGLLDVSGTSITLGSGVSVFNAGTLTFSSAGSVTINEDSSLDLVGINT
ncbi:MAG: DUF4347 domain-containing protein, partial [Rubripirellula sp.]